MFHKLGSNWEPVGDTAGSKHSTEYCTTSPTCINRYGCLQISSFISHTNSRLHKAFGYKHNSARLFLSLKHWHLLVSVAHSYLRFHQTGFEFFIFNDVYALGSVFWVCAQVCTCLQRWQRVPDLCCAGVNRWLWAFWVLGSKLGMSMRAVHALNCWVTSAGPRRFQSMLIPIFWSWHVRSSLRRLRLSFSSFLLSSYQSCPFFSMHLLECNLKFFQSLPTLKHQIYFYSFHIFYNSTWFLVPISVLFTWIAVAKYFRLDNL